MVFSQMNEEALKRICKEVIGQIRPDGTERARVKAVTDTIVNIINQKALGLGIEAHAISVGSTARNTWVHGETDLDVFIMFPADVSEDDLKVKGLALAKNVSVRYEERYASHPYIHAYFYDSGARKEYEVDLVPCFAVKDASALKSAVDRTPLHNEYIMSRISGLEDDVLLLKLFMMCLDIYGSELRRKGFSGYLCELLILRYSSFIELLINASQWSHGERIDLEGEGRYKGEDPLIVIDPVDRNRNVAAAVSDYSFCRFIDAARAFLAQPQMAFFLKPEVNPMTAEEFADRVKKRGTEFVMVLFEAPDTVEDIVFPQLRKAEGSIRNLIEREGFRVYGSEVSVEGDKAFLLFELLIGTLPKLKKHVGPPVTYKHHSEQFKNIYAPNHRIFIEAGRYVAESERRYTDVVSLLKNELSSCSLGKDVSESIGHGYEVLRNEEIRFFEGIGYFFRRYFRGI